MGAIIHLLMGLSYGHAGMLGNDGGLSPVINAYLGEPSDQAACHDDQQGGTQPASEADCAGQCLGCCAHSSCGILPAVSALNLPFLSFEPIAFEPLLKEIYLRVEPHPPRSLRHGA